MARTVQVEGVILKRHNYGETDRVVTLLTREQGKIVCLAKGARKLTSSKISTLEPGNHVKAHLIETKSMPLLTQAVLLADCSSIHHSLLRIRHLSQLLEMVDLLFVEESGEDEIFELVLKLRNHVVSPRFSTTHIRTLLNEMIVALGYQDPRETSYTTIGEYVSVLANRPMRSWEYLHI